MSQKTVVKRRDFIQKFMHEAGLTYDQACRAYTAMIAIVENGLTRGDKIAFGSIGSLTPVVKPPRDVVMGFSRVNGEVIRTKRVFHLEERVDYKFNFFKEFNRKNRLRG